MAYITKKGDKPNMRDVAGEESNPGKRGNPGVMTPVSDKDMDIIRGDSSESGSNSFAKNVQSAVKSLKKDFNNYSKAKKRDNAKVKG